MSSYRDRWMSVVLRALSSTIASKDICSLTKGWICKLGWNDPYMALFNKFSNDYGLLHI